MFKNINPAVNYSLKYFPLIKIECARFKGTSTKVFLDQATYDNNIIDSIESSIEFIKRNIKLGATIGEVYREDRWEYPLLALREIVINAIVHRDYSILGSDIKIAIFDDMMEVTSPWYFLIEKEQVNSGCSELRNQNLGNLFKKLKIIEQWGTGFEKVRKELVQYPEIEFVIDDSGSLFTQIRLVKKDNVGVNVGVNEVYDIIKKHQPIKTKEINKYFDTTQRTIERYIKELKDQNKITYKGSPKTGGYYVV